MPPKNARMGSLWGASRALAISRRDQQESIYIDYDIYISYNHSIMSTVLAPPTISIKDAAARLGVHENTVRAWFDSGILKGYMSPTGRRKVLLDSVERRAREMFGVPADAVELGKSTAPPGQLDTLERAQSRLP